MHAVDRTAVAGRSWCTLLLGFAVSAAAAAAHTFTPPPTAPSHRHWAANNNVAGYTDQKHQVFFLTTGGYDTHDGQLASQPQLLSLLSKSLAGFYRALHSAGLDQKATAFTASDFGRSLSTNGDGTDHGWGSHHFVVGGAVAGGKFYGDNATGSGSAAMPSLALSDNNPNDARYGQIIPTTSVDQYSATLANWFGLGASDIGLLFPNLANFSVQNLKFI